MDKLQPNFRNKPNTCTCNETRAHRSK